MFHLFCLIDYRRLLITYFHAAILPSDIYFAMFHFAFGFAAAIAGHLPFTLRHAK
jgi:hypothetical protein